MKAMQAGRRLLAVLLAVISIAVAAAEPTELRIRDAIHGYGVSARVELAPWPAAQAAATAAALHEALQAARLATHLQTQQGMRLSVPLTTAMAVRVSAPAYRDLLTVIEPGAAAQSWTLWLTPEADAADEAVAADLIHGHVIDPETLAPVADASVELVGSGRHTRSDGRGYFRLSRPAHGAEPALLRAQLRVRAPDGRRVEKTVALAAGADLHLIIDLDPAGGDDPGHRHLLTDAPAVSAHSPAASSLPAAMRGSATQPPASIRVGYGDAGCSTICCTGSCSHVCVYDLETYVRRGLNDEWIASWNTQSLRAGSVAYRSYGAWHALNPVAGRPFDLCSSACCQVNDGDLSANTTAAVERTAGLMLIRNDAVLRSEYSAENNSLLGQMSCSNADLSCGDGFAGSPAAGWPCLADPVGTGQACFGHGRGMSQWGTQRWSLAPHLRSWRWQVDHYFNANGTGSGLRTATISQVLVLVDVRPRRRTVRPGDTLRLDYDASNLAAAAHAHALLGASLRRPPDPYVDDAGNDRRVTLPSGVSAHARNFLLPAALALGRYDLYGSLYLDVDENAAINAGDLAQDLLLRAQAVRVVAAADLIFYDGWQSDLP